MQRAVPSTSDLSAQQSLCEKFFAARVDWPKFVNEIPSSRFTEEISFSELFADRPQAALAVDRSYQRDEVGQEGYVTSLWNCGDGKLFALGRIILQFDLSDLARSVEDFSKSATLSSPVDVPSRAGPGWPDLLETVARRLHEAAVLPSEIEASHRFVKRSEALNQLERTMIHTRIVAENMYVRAAGNAWSALETRVMERSLDHVEDGLRGLCGYLDAYHVQRQPDLSAATFGAGNGSSFDHEGSVLSGPFKLHVKSIMMGLESVADALSQINRRIFDGRR